MQNGIQSTYGTTRILQSDLATHYIKIGKNEFCFRVNLVPESANTEAAWDELKDTATYPLLSSFRSSGLRSELSLDPSTR